MVPTLQKKSKLIAMIAACKWILGRITSLSRRRVYRDGINERAKRYLIDLNRDEQSRAFQVALEMVTFETNLLVSEVALEPECLKLQKRVFELADQYTVAAECVKSMLDLNLAIAMFSTTLQIAHAAGARKVLIDFNHAPHSIQFLLDVDGVWSETARAMSDLKDSLRGAIAQVQGIEYTTLLPHLGHKDPLPTDVRIMWLDNDKVEIVLIPPT